jgi:hypothetical protein
MLPQDGVMLHSKHSSADSLAQFHCRSASGIHLQHQAETHSHGLPGRVQARDLLLAEEASVPYWAMQTCWPSVNKKIWFLYFFIFNGGGSYTHLSIWHWRREEKNICVDIIDRNIYQIFSDGQHIFLLTCGTFKELHCLTITFSLI